MHFDFGFKHSAREATCTLILTLHAGCNLLAAKYVDARGAHSKQRGNYP